MTSPVVDRIRAHLHTVAQLRAARQADPALAERVLAVKTYQARRFKQTYTDLLASPRYRGAAQFFLDELYGPQEFAERDTQFARVVPALVRLFPHEVVRTVEQLGALHALSESLDDATASHLQTDQAAAPLDAAAYVLAWQGAGMPSAREQQIALTQAIGQALDGFTRSRLMRTSLRLMRGPAQAAGLASLQRFLEAGFDAFGAMKGADDFLRWVGERERALTVALFAPDALARMRSAQGNSPLGQLP
jgi:hypothetical protein